MRTFEQNLEIGEAAELALARILREMGCEVEFAPDRFFPDWDLRVRFHNGKPWTVEVKGQSEADEYGHINIEDLAGGLPSGLATTKAEWWAHQIGADPRFYFWGMRSLKNYVERVKLKRYKGGIGNLSEGYLFPIDDFKSQALLSVGP